MCVYGQGVGVVTATGDAAEIGKINALVGSVSSTKTPLLVQLEDFGRVLSIFSVVLAIVTFIVGYEARGMPWQEAFKDAVTVAVAIIPEGLPSVVTITLALGVQHMAKNNAIIRQLPAVETLGSVSVICSDKTGTLTKNEVSKAGCSAEQCARDRRHPRRPAPTSPPSRCQTTPHTLPPLSTPIFPSQMTATMVRTSTGTYRVSGTGYSPEGAICVGDAAIPPQTAARMQQLLLCAGLCNDASLAPAAEADAAAAAAAAAAGTHGGVASANPLHHGHHASFNELALAGGGAATPPSPALVPRGPLPGTSPAAAVEWKLTGDPTDGALLTLSMKAGHRDVKLLSGTFPRIDTIPFECEWRRTCG
jgi:magnesium-transporting ATPase (P-type)